MQELHECLVSILCFARDAEQSLKKSIESLGDTVEIENYSSVYKIFGERGRGETIHDLKTVENFNGLCVSFKATTKLTAKQLMQELIASEGEQNKIKSHTLYIHLLAFDDEVLMTPELTLPNPSLHQSPQLLIPASEVWPTYRHPVLDETLIGLAKKHNVNMWGEFYSQAKSFLDF